MSDTTFDFEAWADLAKTDPEAFETKRKQMIDDFIASAPESLRKRLVGFQWRIDMERERCDNPLQACIRISNMMWDMVYADRGFLWSLQALSDPESLLDDAGMAPGKAEVVALKPAPSS
jgi:hypothetical protein